MYPVKLKIELGNTLILYIFRLAKTFFLHRTGGVPMRRNTVFSQLMQLICHYRFKKSVDEYKGDKYTKRFSCWQQLIVLLFAQTKGLTSLRDIELCLISHKTKWYHLGLSTVAKSTLSDANTNRSADIFRGVFYSLLEKCHELSPRHGFKFHNPLFSISTFT